MSAARNLESLRQFGIAPEDVKTIDGQPWLSSEQLTTIARTSAKFSSVVVQFNSKVDDQIIYYANVTDDQGRNYGRTGVATIGETLHNGETADPHELAASRSLRSVLAMAGFDVFKTAPVVPLRAVESRAIEMVTRSSQIKRLHALATERGLIIRTPEGVDRSGYTAWLEEEFNCSSCAGFTETEFELAINKLNNFVNQ